VSVFALSDLAGAERPRSAVGIGQRRMCWAEIFEFVEPVHAPGPTASCPCKARVCVQAWQGPRAGPDTAYFSGTCGARSFQTGAILSIFHGESTCRRDGADRVAEVSVDLPTHSPDG
jgi:hypothetical protein